MAIKASVYIITLNEEANLVRTLEAIKDFVELIIVDSGSTDKTLEIARKYTDKVYHKDWLGFGKQKNYAASLCNQDYLLSIDADEVVDETLLTEIRQVITNNDCDALRVGINNLFLGKFAHSLTKRNTRVKFYHKAKGQYSEKPIHETIEMDKKARIKNASGIIYDYGTDSLAQKVDKLNNYSSLRALEKKEKNKRHSLLKILFIFPLAFFKFYILKRNFLCGWRGFIEGITIAFYAFLKEAKLYEKNKS